MSHSEASLVSLCPEWFCLLIVVSIDGRLDCGGDSVQLSLAPCQRGTPESGIALPLDFQKSVPTSQLAVWSPR